MLTGFRMPVATFLAATLLSSVAAPGATGSGPTHASQPPAGRHWAAAEWARAYDRGLISTFASRDIAGAAADDPVGPADWNRLVASAFGVAPGLPRSELGHPAGPAAGDFGPAGHRRDALRRLIWRETAGRLVDLPGRPVDRGNAVAGLITLLHQVAGIRAPWVPPFEHGGPAPESDHPLGDFADGRRGPAGHQPHWRAALALGLIGGRPGVMLGVTEPLTWAEAVTLLNRVLDRFDLAAAGRAYGEQVLLPEGVRPLGFLPGQPWGMAGGLGLEVHGAAYTDRLPGVDTPPGHTEASFYWVLVDLTLSVPAAPEPAGAAEKTGGSPGVPQPLPVAEAFAMTLEDAPQRHVRLAMDVAATAALGSPLTDPERTLGPGTPVRGLAVFVVPRGTPNLWYHVMGRIGATAEKKWTSGQRGPLGDLPGPEPVFEADPAVEGWVVVAGHEWSPAAATALARDVRRAGFQAWLESTPSGRYAVVIAHIGDRNSAETLADEYRRQGVPAFVLDQRTW